MSANTKQKNNIWSAIFGTGPDVDTEDSYEIIALHPVLVNALKNIENGKLKKEVEDSLITNGKKGSSNNGGLAPQIDPKTEEAMRAYHKKIEQAQENSKKDKEIGDE